MSSERGSLEPYLKDDVQFHPWQLDGIRHLARKHSFLLADDMGLGKSLEALVIFIIDVFEGYADSLIIVCPPTLIENWCNELDKFTRLKYVICGEPEDSKHLKTKGTVKQQTDSLIEFATMVGPKVLIVNYEKINKHLSVLNSMDFDFGIFDEAHYMQSSNSQRTQACHSLKNGRSAMLTGTPMLNHVDGLWGIMAKIDPDNTPEYWSFVNKFAVFGGFKNKSIVGTKNEVRLRTWMSQYMLRRLAVDHLDLSTPNVVERLVSMTPTMKDIYDHVSADLKVPRPEDVRDEDIEHQIVKFTRLKQVCSNTLAFNGVDESPKLDLCMQDDAELLDQKEKVIVFTQYREVIEAYKARHIAKYTNSKGKLRIPIFELHGDVPQNQRQQVVKQWTNVKGAAVILCMIQVAGVGLNMVASHNIAMVDETFVPGINYQAICRAHRLGQNYPVLVRKYRVRGTVENRVRQINKEKTTLNERLIENSPEWKRKILEQLIEKGMVEDNGPAWL